MKIVLDHFEDETLSVFVFFNQTNNTKDKVGSVYKEMPAGKLLSTGIIVFARIDKLGFKYFHAFIKGAFF